MSSNQNTYGCVMENGKAPVCQPCLGEMSRAQCQDRCRPGVHQLLGCDPSSGLCRQGSGTHESCPQCDQRPCSAQPLGQLLGYRCAPDGCHAVYAGTQDPSQAGVPLFPTLEACRAAGCGNGAPFGRLLGYRCTPDGGCKAVYSGTLDPSEVGVPLFPTPEACRAAGCGVAPQIGHLLGYRCTPAGCKAVYAGAQDPDDVGVPLFPTLEACKASGCGGNGPDIGHLLGYRCTPDGCKAVYAGTPDADEVGVPLFATLDACKAAGCQSWSCDKNACTLVEGTGGDFGSKEDCLASCGGMTPEQKLDIAYALGIAATVMGGLALLALLVWAIWPAFGGTTRTGRSGITY